MNSPADNTDLKTELRALAAELGFDVFGVTGVTAPPRREYYRQWLAAGKNAGMDWMTRNNDKRLAPENFFAEARSIIVVGLNYFQPYPENNYTIARYALGADYHNFLFKKLKKLCAAMRERGGEQRPSVDTAPVMEKPLAALAGLGWQGKSTLLINRRHGAHLLLGTIFTTLALAPDAPEPDRCGTCRRCIDACPTGAITAPGELDARRCLAYLSIEHEGAIPPEFRELAGSRLFGCDDCADACPWNRSAQRTREAKLAVRALPGNLRDTFSWTPADFEKHFAGTPIKRLRLDRWLRNACVVTGNTGDVRDLPALKKLAAGDNTLLAEHATWAIARIEQKNRAGLSRTE